MPLGGAKVEHFSWYHSSCQRGINQYFVRKLFGNEKSCPKIHLTFSFSKCHLSKQQFELKLLLVHFWKLSIIEEAEIDGWKLLPLQNCLIFEVSWNLSCNKMTYQKLIKERNNSLGTFNNRWRFWGKNPKKAMKIKFHDHKMIRQEGTARGGSKIIQMSRRSLWLVP